MQEQAPFKYVLNLELLHSNARQLIVEERVKCVLYDGNNYSAHSRIGLMRTLSLHHKKASYVIYTKTKDDDTATYLKFKKVMPCSSKATLCSP